jgi:uncharacterized protein YecE (DUF72 family)
MAIRIGTAGWALRKDGPDTFPVSGTHLERYASQLNCVEINSSFYRPHRKSTYERWAASTPIDFRFAVKMPKLITHEKRLADCEAELERFLYEARGLGQKLGPLLVQMPPSLAWSEQPAEFFFSMLRAQHQGPLVIEPRHESWYASEPNSQLVEFDISRVAADPSVVPAAAHPGGSMATTYFRWHGSPRTYYSSYSEESLSALAHTLLEAEQNSQTAWCIFDNTAQNAAIYNALTIRRVLPTTPARSS